MSHLPKRNKGYINTGPAPNPSHGGLFKYQTNSSCSSWPKNASQIIHPRAALLSNFEVLTLLRDLEADHLSRSKTAFRVKKEEEASSSTIQGNISHLEASENLRTVEVEVRLFFFFLFFCMMKCWYVGLRQSAISQLITYQTYLKPKKVSQNSLKAWHHTI